MTYEKDLEVLQKAFDKKVTGLANKVRRELIMPVCREHRLNVWDITPRTMCLLVRSAFLSERFFSGVGTVFAWCMSCTTAGPTAW